MAAVQFLLLRLFRSFHYDDFPDVSHSTAEEKLLEPRHPRPFMDSSTVTNTRGDVDLNGPRYSTKN